jgi:tetratricopeptide (TPR) repeat protein
MSEDKGIGSALRPEALVRWPQADEPEDLGKEQALHKHPSSVDLDDFLQGRLSGETAREVVRHLIPGCSVCTAQLEKSRGQLFPGNFRGLTEEENADYLRVLDRNLKTARHLNREAARARKVSSLLVTGGVKAVVQDADLPLRGLGTYHALLERSWAVRFENPREMVSLARAAAEVANRLDPKLYGAQRTYDLKARAWGELANALRVADDLEEAGRAFGSAFEFLRQGTGDPYLKVRLYDLHASYLGTRRQFALAFAALDYAFETYLELGEKHLAGRAYIVKAIYSHYSGDPSDALRLGEIGLALLDKDREPELLFFAIHNQIQFLVACDRLREAKKLLFIYQVDLLRVHGRVSHLKLRWLQAQVSAGLGEWVSAEHGFLEARAGLEAIGMGFHAALASLDLALLLMRRGRNREAESFVLGAADVFMALGIHREALGSIMILRDSFEKRQGTIVLLESVIEFLRRSQIDPEARFTPRFK